MTQSKGDNPYISKIQITTIILYFLGFLKSKQAKQSKI